MIAIAGWVAALALAAVAFRQYRGGFAGDRLAVAAVVAAPIALLVAALFVSRGPETITTPTHLRPPDGLDLLALRPSRAGGNLVVTGTVRVRGDGTAPITAVVTALDREGRAIASGHAPLDDARLDVDSESSFQVAVPAPGDVERYQVRFETPLGPLAHLDQRAGSPRDHTP
jgi:hypothetical protein